MTTLLQDLAGPGGIRPISARWVVTGQLEVVTVTHLGGGRQDAVDMALLRHPVDRTPMLPGASLAGALRSHLADRLSGYGQPEPPLVARLFGGARGDDQGGQSPLIVYDSFARLPRDVPIEIRDGVAIDAATGTAEAHKKYDAEVLPPGTRFPLRFDLVVPDSAQEQELVDALAAALQGLEAGEIGLGARRSRGWGQIKVDQWLAGRFDLTDAAGWVAWATSDHLEPWRDQPSTGCWSQVEQAIAKAWPRFSRLSQTQRDERRRCRIELALEIPHGLLVRSVPAQPDAPDVVQMRAGGRNVLPGTSLAGVLRQRMAAVARLVRQNQRDAQAWIEDLWGPRLRGTEDPDFSPWGSRVRVRESYLEQATPLRTNRIRLDRFTQGVMHGALFDEEPVFGARLQVGIELRDPRPGELGLLLLTLKDLLTGDLAVGGAGSVGRGLARGSGRLVDEQGTVVSLTFPAPDRDREVLDGFIRAFHAAAPRSPKVGGIR